MDGLRGTAAVMVDGSLTMTAANGWAARSAVPLARRGALDEASDVRQALRQLVPGQTGSARGHREGVYLDPGSGQHQPGHLDQ
jgi:hypothetical protein